MMSLSKRRVCMSAIVKRISAAFLTAIVLISLFSFSVSADVTNDASAGISEADVTTSEAYTAPAGATVTYRTRGYKKKWQKYKKQGYRSGYINKKTRSIEAIQIKVKSSVSGKIQYNTHAYKRGWSGYKTNGKTAGGKKQRIDMIRIKLTGELAEKYDVYYRVHLHIQRGWLAWAKNGEDAGARDYAFYIDAIQIVLTEKDADAPGAVRGIKTQRNFKCYNADNIRSAMIEKAQSMSSSTKWLILCDTQHYFAGVFTGSKGNWKLVRFIYISVGKPSSPTKKGVFKIKNRKKKFYSGAVRCKYCTRFTKAYYFHSLPYSWDGKRIVSTRLGQRCTHGCVRMPLDDAKYIYKKVPKKSTAWVY